MKTMYTVKYYCKRQDGTEFSYISGLIYESHELAKAAVLNPSSVIVVKAEVLTINVDDENPTCTIQYEKVTQQVEVLQPVEV